MTYNEHKRLVCAVWKHLPDQAKEVYKERAIVDKDRFDREILAETIAHGGKRLFCHSTERVRGKGRQEEMDAAQKAMREDHARFMQYSANRISELSLLGKWVGAAKSQQAQFASEWKAMSLEQKQIIPIPLQPKDEPDEQPTIWLQLSKANAPKSRKKKMAAPTSRANNDDIFFQNPTPAKARTKTAADFLMKDEPDEDLEDALVSDVSEPEELILPPIVDNNALMEF